MERVWGGWKRCVGTIWGGWEEGCIAASLPAGQHAQVRGAVWGKRGSEVWECVEEVVSPGRRGGVNASLPAGQHALGK